MEGKKTGQLKEITDWHRVVFFSGLAKIVGEYLTKGSQVCIEGKLKTRQYTKDGIERYVTEIRADELLMLGGGTRKDSAEAKALVEEGVRHREEADAALEHDDIPF